MYIVIQQILQNYFSIDFNPEEEYKKNEEEKQNDIKIIKNFQLEE